METATKQFSDSDLRFMELRARVLEVSLQSAAGGAIKSPVEYCEEMWAWVSDVGQPPTPAAPPSDRNMPRKARRVSSRDNASVKAPR